MSTNSKNKKRQASIPVIGILSAPTICFFRKKQERMSKKADWLETMFRTRDDAQLKQAFHNLVAVENKMYPDMTDEFRGAVEYRAASTRDGMHYFMILALINVEGFRNYCYQDTNDTKRLDSFIEYLRGEYKTLLEGRTRTPQDTEAIYPTFQHFVWKMRFEYLLRADHSVLVANYVAPAMVFERPKPIGPIPAAFLPQRLTTGC